MILLALLCAIGLGIEEPEPANSWEEEDLVSWESKRQHWIDCMVLVRQTVTHNIQAISQLAEARGLPLKPLKRKVSASLLVECNRKPLSLPDWNSFDLSDLQLSREESELLEAIAQAATSQLHWQHSPPKPQPSIPAVMWGLLVVIGLIACGYFLPVPRPRHAKAH